MPTRPLTLLVVFMGLLIIGGITALAVIVTGRIVHSRMNPAPFAAAPVELPAGARIETMSAGADRLVLDVVLADGSRQLVVIDLASGRRLGTIPLVTMQ